MGFCRPDANQEHCPGDRQPRAPDVALSAKGVHYACLDIGTNSVLLLIARGHDSGNPTEVSEQFRVTRLGAGVDATGKLSEIAMARTLDAVRDFMRQASSSAPRPLFWSVLSTSAIRDAVNGPAFLAACREVCGCVPRTLPGDDEAETVFAGASSDLPPDTPVITIDIGGGSTEIAYGRSPHCTYRKSLDIGCVRFGERFGLFEAPDPEDCSRAAHEAFMLFREAVSDVVEAGGDNPDEVRVIASGGTATTFAALAQKLRVYAKERVDGYVAEVSAVEAMANRLLDTPLAERRAIPGLQAGRARVFPAGLLILRQCLKALGKQRFSVTTRGLRYGLAKRMAAGELAPMMVWK